MPSKNYSTGTEAIVYSPNNPAQFSRFVSQELGVASPVGEGRRKGLYKFISSEMKEHDWSWDDLIHAVVYLKRRNIRLRSQYGVLYFIEEAKNFNPPSDIAAKISRAVELEEDERWRRRLSNASGKIADKVYESWVKERGKMYGIQ